MQKKIKYVSKVFLLFFLLIILSGCNLNLDQNKFNRDANKKGDSIESIDNIKNRDLIYRNTNYNYKITLPPSFIGFVTKDREVANYVYSEILVPTEDLNYPTDTVGYAKPIVIRVYNLDFWENLPPEERVSFHKLLTDKNKVYVARVWKNLPIDWVNTWNKDMENKILNSFVLIK